MKDDGTKWLEARGLDIELAAKMGWDTATRKDGTLWMSIPYIRDGKKITTQYRRLDEKEFRFAAGSEAELWNCDVLRDETLADHPLVIAEGACDGLALIQSGYIRTVAVPGWSNKNFEADRYEPFKRNEQYIKTAKKIVVAQHDDNTGAAMLKAVANFFDEQAVCYVKWPKGCKDANDTLLMHGPEAVVAAINGAKEVDPPGGLITGFTDLPPYPERRIWHLDFPEFDKLMAFRSREISVVTGTPGSGKTTFMTWVAHHLVRANDLRVGLALFETDPAEVFDQLFRIENGGRQWDYAEDRIAAVRAHLDRNFRLLHRVEGTNGEDVIHGMAWLKAMIHKAAARDGCNVIIIDPWNELEHMLEKGESVTNYTNFALMRLRQWAEQYDIHICVVAHPRKMQDGERPGGYHVADSAAFVNKPGLGLTIHLEKEKYADDGSIEIPQHVSLTNWKTRNIQQMGCRPGFMRMHFDEERMTYRGMK